MNNNHDHKPESQPAELPRKMEASHHTGSNAEQEEPNETTNEKKHAGTAASSEPKLTVKQEKWVDAYLDPTQADGNRTLASKIAAYKGNTNQLGVQGYDNFHNPKIQRVIASRLGSMKDRALQRLNDGLDASSSRVFMGKDGTLVSSDPVPDYRVRVGTARFILDLYSKYAAVLEEGDEGEVAERIAGGEQMDPADQAMSEEVAAIDAELGQLDSGPNDDSAYASDHVGDVDE